MILHPVRHRPAFTILEIGLALAMLMVGATIVGQVMVWSMAERLRIETRLQAMEWAADVLESARAAPWDKLTPEWAAQQKLPEPFSDRMKSPSVKVQVEPEEKRPHLKQITIQLQWMLPDGTREAPISLSAFIAERRSP
ncbi:MAG: hypothetical protein ACJ8C4_20950 [Gemmataceae bacterium]